MSDTPEPAAAFEPAAPGHRDGRELAARVMTIVMLAWLCLLAAMSWIAFREGYTGLLLPAWNSLFVLGTLPVVAGVFARRLWAQRWVVGISAFTAIGNAMQASRMDSTLLWIGALLLAAAALTVRHARPVFNDSDGNRGIVQQVIAAVVTIGSIVVSLQVMQGTGTERGRASFVVEVQQGYDAAGASTVHVYQKGLDLVIESRTDTDDQIDAGARAMHDQLAKTGRRAKAWVYGFEHIIVTNGTHQRVLSPDDP